MKKLLSLAVIAASLTLFSCNNETHNEGEGTDVDTVKTENTEINTNTEMNVDTTGGHMNADTTHMHTDTTKTMTK